MAAHPNVHINQIVNRLALHDRGDERDSMNYRRGFFRLWLTLTAIALIVAPFWWIHHQTSNALYPCFEVMEFHFKDTPETTNGTAPVGVALPHTICTDPVLFDPDLQAIERLWKNLDSLKVKFGFEDVETVFPAKMGNYFALVSLAMTKYKRAEFDDALKDIPYIEGSILILAGILWWSVRLAEAITTWIRRGFSGS